jgi:hypothetical protein
MTIAITVLTVMVLLLAYGVGERQRLLQALLIQNKLLQDHNAWLRSQRAAPDVDVSDFTDREASTSFAVKCGYIGAVQSYNVKEDPRHRADALREALEYFRRHVADHVAAANH